MPVSTPPTRPTPAADAEAPSAEQELAAFALLLERGSLVQRRVDAGVDAALEADYGCTLVQAKWPTAKRGARPVTRRPAEPEAWLILEGRALLQRYAESRMADPKAASLLTERVLEIAGRTLARSRTDDLATRLITLATRTANDWEDASRRAHATAPPLRPCPTLAGPDRDMAVSMWDFGGQEVYRKTRHPARSRYPDLAASRAVVVGAGRSPELPDLPEAEASAAALAGRLADVVAQPTVVRGEQATRERTLHAVDRAAGEATDLLLVYFSGHGRLEPDRQLSLGTADADIGFGELAERVRGTRAAHLVFVIDACGAGAAANALRPGDGTAARDDYVIAATSEREAALARHPSRDHGYTVFTGALLDALTRGVPEAGEELDIATLYGAVDRALARDSLPRPHLFAAGASQSRWALAPNPRARSKTRRSVRRDPDEASLLAQVADGDQEAWNALIERYSKLVWSTARSFRLTDDECGAVFHSTWRLFICDPHELQERNLPQWLTDTARRGSLQALRKRADQGTGPGCPACEGRARDRTAKRP